MKPSMSEQDLIRQLGDLPREIRPRRDPWQQISARIGSASRSDAALAGGRRWLPMAAAAAVLVIVTGLFLGPLRIDSPKPEPVSDVAGGPPAGTAPGALTLKGTLAASETEYQAAFREFITVDDSLGILPPATVETIEAGWAELNNTETVLAAALEAHPDNPFLNDRMLELRARQLGFLKQLARLDRNNRRMTI